MPSTGIAIGYLLITRLFRSVSDPYSLNPDPAKNLHLDPDLVKFFSPTKNLLEIEEKKM